MKMESLDVPFKFDKEKSIALINTVFASNQEAFAAINTNDGVLTMFLKEDKYKEFKKLKIKHKKEVVEDEDKLL